MRIEVLEQKEISKEMLPQIINRIFAICQLDDNLPIREELGQIDDVMSDLDKKIEKKDSLLIQSSELIKNLTDRLNVLKEENFQTKSRLLETLGSGL